MWFSVICYESRSKNAKSVELWILTHLDRNEQHWLIAWHTHFISGLRVSLNSSGWHGVRSALSQDTVPPLSVKPGQHTPTRSDSKHNNQLSLDSTLQQDLILSITPVKPGQHTPTRSDSKHNTQLSLDSTLQQDLIQSITQVWFHRKSVYGRCLNSPFELII